MKFDTGSHQSRTNKNRVSKKKRLKQNKSLLTIIPTLTHPVSSYPTVVSVEAVGPDSFHIFKALNDDGLGTASSVLVGIEGCMNSGSRIISMSLGGGPSSDMVAPVDGRRQRDERQKASR
jgi:hypothetical protein